MTMEKEAPNALVTEAELPIPIYVLALDNKFCSSQQSTS